MDKSKITSVNRLNVTFMIISGFSEEYIAANALQKPISVEQYKEWFADEIENGERKLNMEMAQNLFASAKRGNVLAISTWLKARAKDKWSESVKLENGDKPFIVRVENTLKGDTRTNN